MAEIYTPHDSGYKKMFSHPLMVESLLRDWVNEEWVGEIDFSSLENIGTEHITDSFNSRYNDLIWKIQFQEKELYIFLMMEFQSSVDISMAVRMSTYTGLLYEELLTRGEYRRDENGEILLPPIFPIVLYNGAKPWTAKRNIAEMIMPMANGLQRYLPQSHYFLLEVRNITEEAKRKAESITAKFFRLDQFSDKDLVKVKKEINELIPLLAALKDERLTKLFSEWINELLTERIKIKDKTGSYIELQPMEDGMEATFETVLDRVNFAMEKLRDAGREEGLEEGMQQGMQQGRSAVLAAQMQQKFNGRYSDAIAKRLQNATTEELDIWTVRILFAETIDEIFDEEEKKEK